MIISVTTDLIKVLFESLTEASLNIGMKNGDKVNKNRTHIGVIHSCRGH